MKGSGWLCIVMTLLTSSAWADNSLPKHCQLKLVGALDVAITPEHEILVPVSIDGSPFSMRLNPQSAGSVLHQSFVQSRRLHREPLSRTGVRYGASTVTEFAEVKGFVLGNATFQWAHFFNRVRSGQAQHFGERVSGRYRHGSI
jgi:hypothetical protein